VQLLAVNYPRTCQYRLKLWKGGTGEDQYIIEKKRFLITHERNSIETAICVKHAQLRNQLTVIPSLHQNLHDDVARRVL
jgi:hypothetical protein